MVNRVTSIRRSFRRWRADGFPISSHLYRNILPQLAKTHRAIALPGYGLSDKPLDLTYDYDFYADVLDGFPAVRLGPDRAGYPKR